MGIEIKANGVVALVIGASAVVWAARGYEDGIVFFGLSSALIIIWSVGSAYWHNYQRRGM